MSDADSVTPFAECPNCGKLLELESTQCPECREPIKEDYAVLSAISNVINTQACNDAKDIQGRNRIMVLVVLGESIPTFFLDQWVFGYLLLFWMTLVPSVMQVLVTAVWHLRFGGFPLGDADYVQAKIQVRRSATLWAAILILQLAVLIGSRQ